MDLFPSAQALQAAQQLGMEMAKREKKITPILEGTHQYLTYLQYITAHRHQLESIRAFGPWGAKLHCIATAEGKRHELRPDDPQQWDPFLNRIFIPIRCSFWYGWERANHLQRLYDQQVKAAQPRSGTPAVLHVYNPPASSAVLARSSPEQAEEEKPWEGIAPQVQAQPPQGTRYAGGA